MQGVGIPDIRASLRYRKTLEGLAPMCQIHSLFEHQVLKSHGNGLFTLTKIDVHASLCVTISYDHSLMKASGVCGVPIRAPCYGDALYWCLHEFWECQRCSVSTTVPCLHEARLCDLQYMRWFAPTGRVIGNWSVLPFEFRDFHLAPSKVAEKTKWRPILRHEPPGKGAGWLSALKTPQKSPWDKTDWTFILIF